MTALGVFFVPVILVCFLWRPSYLLALVIVASIFEAGSVYNGSLGQFEFGISPFYLTEIFIFIRLVGLYFSGAKLLPPRDTPMRPIVVALCVFWVWSVASAFIMPRVFAGIPIISPRGVEEAFTPLQWTLSNLAQAGYLTLNMGTLLYALQVIRTHSESDRLMGAFYLAIFVAVIIGAGQFLASQAGLDFPYEFFNNNPSYAQGIDQDLGAYRRVNCTFTEPSNAGSYLAAVNCGLLAGFLSSKRKAGFLVAILACMTVLFLTTSSTGFAALLLGFPLLVIYFNISRHHKHTGKSSGLSWVVILLVIGAVASIVLFLPDLLQAIVAMTVEKGETYSFWVRLADELHSIELFLETYGLGVGLGSSRSSGLITTLVSCVGIIGISLLSFAFYRIGKWFFQTPASRPLIVAFWTLVTLLISAAVAIPDLNRPVLWAFLIMVLTRLNTDHFLLPHRAAPRKLRIAPVRALDASPGVAPAG